jgi:hypothetical protein
VIVLVVNFISTDTNAPDQLISTYKTLIKLLLPNKVHNEILHLVR